MYFGIVTFITTSYSFPGKSDWVMCRLARAVVPVFSVALNTTASLHEGWTVGPYPSFRTFQWIWNVEPIRKQFEQKCSTKTFNKSLAF